MWKQVAVTLQSRRGRRVMQGFGVSVVYSVYKSSADSVYKISWGL